MITAVDTSVLIDVFAADPEHGQTSAAALRQCLREGTLAVCDVVWAETRAVFDNDEAFRGAMDKLGAVFSPLSPVAAAHAGSAWRGYRKAGGSRERVMADFLIGAHALHQADRLLTRDRGYYRRHFRGLRLAAPAGPSGPAKG